MSLLFIFSLPSPRTLPDQFPWTANPTCAMTTITLVKSEPDSRHTSSTPVLPVIPITPAATPAPQSAFIRTTSRVSVDYPAKGHCPVCYRAACPLKTHKQYARSRRLHVRKPVPHRRQLSCNLSTPSTDESSDCHCGIHRRLVGLGGARVDCFLDFPLPIGVKAEVHELFQDCKPTIPNLAFVVSWLGQKHPSCPTATHQHVSVLHRQADSLAKFLSCIRPNQPLDQKPALRP